ncbi:MAG: transposase [Candidatus Levybacteria bacterium]|nr:transposase [Candidatus Levybacteria bacterium]
MPSKNIIKTYVEGGYYHIYNRGVEKREIFKDESDCRIFLHCIMLYLSPVDEILQKYPDKIRIRRFIKSNLSEEVELLCFALMPNHFHFLIKQNSKDGIIKFMRRLMTSYVMYFNKKYQRVGTLFQGRYKAVNIDRDEYLLHLTRYIHLNPFEINSDINFKEFSSYIYYTSSKHPSWIKPKEILDYFSLKDKEYKVSSYKSFVEDSLVDSSEILEGLTID